MPEKVALCLEDRQAAGKCRKERLVGEGKTATGRTLTRMLIWRSLMQAELNKFFSRGSAWSGTDEQMVQLDPDAR